MIRVKDEDGCVWRSDIGKLSEILVGCSIQITSRRGNFTAATV